MPCDIKMCNFDGNQEGTTPAAGARLGAATLPTRGAQAVRVAGAEAAVAGGTAPNTRHLMGGVDLQTLELALGTEIHSGLLYG